ncbi:uncharacterized protein METZ01_LOCUS471886, partial [marine metagenome]
MSGESITTKASQDIGHEVGENNIQFLGLDIHNRVFVISAVLGVAVVIGTLMFQAQAAVFFADIRNWITVKFDWFFAISADFFLV